MLDKKENPFQFSKISINKQQLVLEFSKNFNTIGKEL